MTLLFWIAASAMLVLAMALIVPRLLRGATAPVSEAAADARRRLQSLESAYRDGHLEEADFASRKSAIAQTLLEVVDTPETQPRSPRMAIFLLVVTPALTLALYLNIGTPRALGVAAPAPVAASAGDPANAGAPELADAMTQLVARLASNPQDVDGWFLLGRTYRTMNRFADAQDAYRKALELAPRTPPIMVELAEAIAFASGQGDLPDEARRLLAEAIALDPNSQKGLWMLGLDAFNAGRYDIALGHWEPLLAQLEPGGGAATQVSEQINLARQRLGSGSSAAAAAAPAVAPAAQGSALTVQISLAADLRSKVSPGDTLFVFARAHNGPPMPLAIQRLTAGQLPATVRLDGSMAMMPAMSLDKFPQVIVGARISKTGNASAQPGDMEALSDPISNLRAEPVELEISTVL